MSRAKRIVRMTFWMNNVALVALGVLVLGRLWALPITGTLVAMLLLVTSYWILAWTLNQRYHVKQRPSGMWYTDDERERAIALKVHSACLTGMTNGVWGLIALGSILFLVRFETQTLLLTLLAVAYLIAAGANVQYYYLWWRYDQD